MKSCKTELGLTEIETFLERHETDVEHISTVVQFVRHCVVTLTGTDHRHTIGVVFLDEKLKSPKAIPGSLGDYTFVLL